MVAVISELVVEFAYEMAVLWNRVAARALYEDERAYPEWIDLGGEA